MVVAGESPGTLMATMAADHAFLMAMVADTGGTNTNANVDMDMIMNMNMDMAIAVGDFRGGFGPPSFLRRTCGMWRFVALPCPAAAPYPLEERIANRSSDLGQPNYSLVEWHAIEDDCWSIDALRDVNSLAASIALRKNLMATMRFSLI
jgi:hypothetical protein